jgi:ornithine lipid hydroxylase
MHQSTVKNPKPFSIEFRTLFSVLLYPLCLFGAVGCSWALLQLDIHKSLPVLIPILSITPILLMAESRWPASGSSSLHIDQIKVDLMHSILWHGILPAMLRAGVAGSCFAASAFVTKTTGIALWPTSWPIGVQLFLALMVGELLAYWIHRFGHETSIGWRFHALHHSPKHLNALSAGRNHPINVTASYLGQLIPLLFLGVPAEVLALHAVFTGINGPLQHVNLTFRSGILNWICSTPELHHWHHSRTIKESNSNYGSNLILWDIIFGTRFLPRHRARPQKMGLLYPFPPGFRQQLLWAFGPLPENTSDLETMPMASDKDTLPSEMETAGNKQAA